LMGFYKVYSPSLVINKAKKAFLGGIMHLSTMD
jgi:hypothetical protein